MTIVLAIITGVLFAGGLYAMMQRSLIKLVVGLSLLSYSVNLAIFVVGRLVRAAAPLLPADGSAPTVPFGDPVPQALILTAIVISFGLYAFAIVLVKRVYVLSGSSDVDDLTTTDE